MSCLSYPIISFMTLLSYLAGAQGIQEYNYMPNAARLELKFCMFDSHFCVWKRAIAFGQVCDPWLAQDMGMGKSGDVEGGMPSWGRYAGWRCIPNDPKACPVWGLSGGQTTPDPSDPNRPPYNGNKDCTCKKTSAKNCAVLVNEKDIPIAYCGIHASDGSCSTWVITSTKAIKEGKFSVQ